MSDIPTFEILPIFLQMLWHDLEMALYRLSWKSVYNGRRNRRKTCATDLPKYRRHE